MKSIFRHDVGLRSRDFFWQFFGISKTTTQQNKCKRMLLSFSIYFFDIYHSSSLFETIRCLLSLCQKSFQKILFENITINRSILLKQSL